MRQRHLGKLFGILVVTLGLYQIYWLVRTRRELLRQVDSPIPPVWAIFLPFGIFIIILLLGFVVAHAVGADGQEGSVPTHFLSTLGLGAFVAMFIVPIVWIRQYGKAIEEVTGHETSQAYVFWMWLIAPVIWPIIMQHEFNIVAHNHTAKKAQPSKKERKAKA